MTLPRGGRVFASAILLLLAGCSSGMEADYASIGLVPVHGTVSLDSQPLAGATVVYESTDQTFSTATTDPEGRYEMQFNSEVAGVTPGEKVVRITLKTKIGEEADDEESGADGERPVRVTRRTKVELPSGELPPTYNRQSELRVMVDADQPEINFDLAGDGSTRTSG